MIQRSALAVHAADASHLDRAHNTPLSQQVYQRLRSAIEQGALRAGDRVASARSLAVELGVARGTVEVAYALLAGEGYLLPRGQAGTFVSPALPSRKTTRPAISSIPVDVPPPVTAPPPLQLGIPALDAFPRKLWARIAARRVRALGPADLFYGDPSGHPPLREALAAYLRVSRGVACHPAQVIVTGGYRASLALCVRALLAPGERAWVEDPCFPPTLDVLRDLGRRGVAVPVDGEGLVVERGRRKALAARLAIVTPSHQAPMGVSMSLPRRLQLLAWAQAAGAWILEDDYDGEYRYAGAPLPALKSLDDQHRVLYAGSFSKVLHPGLALGYLVVPESLRERFGAAARLASNGPPQLTQAIVADFLRGGHFPLHLKKMRLLYARRRTLLAQALRHAFGDKARIELAGGGMHLIARFDRHRLDDVALAGRAQRAGLNCQPLSVRGVVQPAEQGLLMGFTNVVSEAEANRIAARLRAAWH